MAKDISTTSRGYELATLEKWILRFSERHYPDKCWIVDTFLNDVKHQPALREAWETFKQAMWALKPDKPNGEEK